MMPVMAGKMTLKTVCTLWAERVLRGREKRGVRGKQVGAERGNARTGEDSAVSEDLKMRREMGGNGARLAEQHAAQRQPDRDQLADPEETVELAVALRAHHRNLHGRMDQDLPASPPGECRS